MAGKKGRSGRKKGQKNYKKVGYGSVENQYGVRFTASEQEEFRKRVQQANYQRKKRIKELPPVSQQAYKDFGRETDFFYRKKSQSMQQFKSKKEFRNYMKSLNNMATGSWIDKKQRVYQESYKEKIRRTFAVKDPVTGRWVHTKESLELVKGVNKLSASDFAKLVENEEIDPLGEWYKGDDKYGRYVKVKSQLNKAISK